MRFPQSYQDSCYLSADATAVQQYINPTKEEHLVNESYSDVVDNEADCSPCLPPIPKRMKLNITEEAITSRITLKTIENLTYNLTDTDVLLAQQLRKDLDELY